MLVPEALARRALEQFVRQLMGEGRSPRSVGRLVACLRSFYRYLAVNGRITASPAADLHAPRAVRTLPRFLTVDEVDALLAAPDTATPRGLRDRAMIELLYATGLRVPGRVWLKGSGVNLQEGSLTAVGTGRKERLVPLGEEAASWVRRYVQDGRAELVASRSSPRLFVRARGGGPLSRIGFWKV